MLINTKNKTDRLSLLTCLIALGGEWHKGTMSVKGAIDVDASYNFDQYPCIGIAHGKSISGYPTSRGLEPITWPDDAKVIVEYMQNDYTVDGIGDYTAEVTKTGIKVGCQTISFKKFKELNTVVDKYQEAN